MERTVRSASFILVTSLAIGGSQLHSTAVSLPASSSAVWNARSHAAASSAKVDICHQTGAGGYHLMNINQNAERAHRAHGDAAPGESVPGGPGTFDSACHILFDPVADYDAGWLSGSNPNGVWRYGWSSTLTSALTLYPQNYITTQDCGASTYRVWNDPANNVGFTPAVIKNIGPTCSNGNVDIPTGVLTQHYGGTGSTTDYSHVVFTAPFTGTYEVAITFTGRQNGLNSDVNVVVNGLPVLGVLITANLQTVAYTASLSLTAGDTLDFATGPGTTSGLHPGHIGLSGTITFVP
jgi:hypothetical protein